MKKILLISFVLISVKLLAQQEITLLDQNGLQITYKSQKLESNSNKDKYLLSVAVINKTNTPLYYAVKANKSGNGVADVDPLASLFLGKVIVRNATGGLFSSDDIKVKGEKTDIFTNNQAHILYKFDPDRTYNFESHFSVKSNDTLMVGYTSNYVLKSLNGFDLDMSGGAINGTYKSNCGTTIFTLNYVKDNFLVSNNTMTVGAYISVAINGKTTKWIRKSPVMFVRDIDQNSSLTLDKFTGKIFYNSSDGISCELIRM